MKTDLIELALHEIPKDVPEGVVVFVLLDEKEGIHGVSLKRKGGEPLRGIIVITKKTLPNGDLYCDCSHIFEGDVVPTPEEERMIHFALEEKTRKELPGHEVVTIPREKQ